MRSTCSWMVLILLAGLGPQARAYTPNENPPDPASISAMEARIQDAPPREQCFLYAELIHQMTEFSIRQYNSGNPDKANAMLARIKQVTHKLQMSISENDKRLKNAEILLRHTAFRLNEMLHASSYEDRPLVQQTLTQVNEADAQAMLQVMKK